jgi:hypothetical protein
VIGVPVDEEPAEGLLFDEHAASSAAPLSRAAMRKPALG